MDIRIEPHALSGTIRAIPSKSLEHRDLILTALSTGSNKVPRFSDSNDIRATWTCLEALGCRQVEDHEGLHIASLQRDRLPQCTRLDVGESGSTLRFLLPIVAALGCGTTFVCQGRLASRPLAPLDEQLVAHGVHLCKSAPDCFELSGTLTPGTFYLPGNVSSQFVSGILMAAPLMDEQTEIVVSEPVESRAYIDLTIQELLRFGVHVCESHRADVAGNSCTVFTVPGTANLSSPQLVSVEGDWSDSAFWLAAASIGTEGIHVEGLDTQSRQGDRAIVDVLSSFGTQIHDEKLNGRHVVSAAPAPLQAHEVNVSGIPDLAAPIAAVAAVAKGTTRLTGAGRLRLKESDRIESIRAALEALGGTALVQGDTLVIEGCGQLTGGTVDAANDHRIAMMAAICAAYASGPSVIRGASCVAKSHPGFFDDFRTLGGIAYEEA